ncbi:MAG: hypoxanthine phosphoribosyltransferase [Candidatus Latescibacteria bacterium]|nr:hypoxanthine phosphoribosyltransferase [Candidatus Latescibacterota bacterium]
MLIDRETVERRIGELAVDIAADYPEAPLFVGILTGAAQFMMALIDRLPEEMLARLDYDFVDVSSYQGTESTGQVELVKDLAVAVEGRDVLVIDGIVDTGRSLDFVLEMIRTRRPDSLKTCALLDKSARRALPVPVDYCGFEIEDAFVVGYGMDYDQRYRALRHIAIIE